MSDEAKRDSAGRWLPGSSGMPLSRRAPQQAVRLVREGLERDWPSRLPPELEELVHERESELTGGRFEELSETRRAFVRNVVRDEIVASRIEVEVLAGKRTSLVDKRRGVVRPWVETLTKLRESLSRRYEKLEKMLEEMGSKPADNALREYVNGKRGESE